MTTGGVGLTAATAPTSLVDGDNPWPGLASFREMDEAFFKGRSNEIDELRRAVESQRLTVLFGASGLGKTSLLHAGLFPRLRLDDELPIWIRLDWSQAAAGPMAQVESELFRQAADRRVETPARRDGETLWELLHRRDTGFWSERNRLLTPVVVLDQFEEAFSSSREDDGSADRVRAFLAELADVVEGRPPALLRERTDAAPSTASSYDFARHRYRLVLSLREDYLAELEGLRAIMPSVAHGRFRLKPMNGEQALEVVDQTGGRLIERSVAEQVVRLAAGTGLDDARVPLSGLLVDPSLLSLFCRELNNRRQADRLEKITTDLVRGNQSNVLEGFYEQCMGLVSPGTRRFVEDELLTSRGQRASREYDDVVLRPGVTRQDIDMLVDARLLRAEERGGVRRLELTHDVLTQVVRPSRDRRRQRERLEAEQAAERTRLEAAQAAERERIERERDQQVAEKERQRADKEAELGRLARQRATEKARAAKLFRSLAGALAVVAILACWFAWSAYQDREAARADREAARTAQLEAQDQARKASDGKEAAEAALKALQLATAGKAVQQEEVQLRYQAETLLAVAQRGQSPAPSPTATSTSAQPTPAKPRVYIQVQSASAKAGAERTIPALQAGGFVVPGVELLKVGPRRTEVRYFRKGEQAGADAVAAILRAQSVPNVEVTYVAGQENSTSIRPGHYEIWFAPDAFG